MFHRKMNLQQIWCTYFYLWASSWGRIYGFRWLMLLIGGLTFVYRWKCLSCFFSNCIKRLTPRSKHSMEAHTCISYLSCEAVSVHILSSTCNVVLEREGIDKMLGGGNKAETCRGEINTKWLGWRLAKNNSWTITPLFYCYLEKFGWVYLAFSETKKYPWT